jgi:hypothetical protein
MENPNANAAAAILSPSESLLLNDTDTAVGEVNAAIEDGVAKDNAEDTALPGSISATQHEEHSGDEDADYSHHTLEGNHDDGQVISGPTEEESHSLEHDDQESHAQDPFPLTTADDALEFINQDEADLPENVLRYQATVQWQDYTVPLFPNPSVQSRYFSTDLSLLNKDISNFFKASREILKSQVGESNVLELRIPQLYLTIDEVSGSIN